MYGRLKDEIQGRVKGIARGGELKIGPELLSYYCQEWQNYKFAVRVLNGTCRYLNRHWVQRERDERGEDKENS